MRYTIDKTRIEDSLPLVSVVMASYNEPVEYIGMAIESILLQSYKNLELIIVDDSTNKETIDKIRSYSDERLKLISLSGHSWLPTKLNLGIENARGKYIARMDADDEALKDRIAKQVDFLENHKEISVLGGQVNLMDGRGKIFSEKRYPLGGSKLYFHSAYKIPFNHPSVMMRRELFDKGYRYNEELIKTSEDIDLWLRIYHDGNKIANLPEKITNYRIRTNMAEWRGSRQEVEYMAKVRRQTFSLKKPFHSTLSFLAGMVFLLLPNECVTTMYRNMYQKQPSK